MCFLCQSKDQLSKYKDLRQCHKCKAYWKGKRLLKQDAQALFLLEVEDLEDLPHKETPTQDGGPPVYLYAFATCAGAALRRYGSLYAMVKSQPQQREVLAHQISSERAFAEQQKLDSDFESSHGQSSMESSRPIYTSNSVSATSDFPQDDT